MIICYVGLSQLLALTLNTRTSIAAIVCILTAQLGILITPDYSCLAFLDRVLYVTESIRCCALLRPGQFWSSLDISDIGKNSGGTLGSHSRLKSES